MRPWRGFVEAQADGIMRVSTGGSEFLSGIAVKDMVAGARAPAAFARVLGEHRRVNTQCAFARAVAAHRFANYDGVLKVDGDVGQMTAYDPRPRGREAAEAMATRVAEAPDRLGSGGRSVLR